MLNKTLVGLGIGLGFGLVAVLIGAPARLGFGLALGLAIGIFDGLLVNNVVVSNRLDEGLSASRSSAALHTLAFGLVAGLVIGLGFGLVAGLVFGLGLAPVAGVDRGGWYLFMQHRLRHQAARQGLLPRDVVPFLVMAVDVGLLRRTAGGVQFRHRALVDRLAQEAPNGGLADLRQRVGTEERG
jgi:hypothetical protein